MITDRQQEIIEASVALINEGGIQALTIKNIAGRIGVTEPAIYRHFKSKSDILATLLDLLKKNSKKIYDNRLEEDGSALEKLSRIFRSHFMTFAKMPSLSSVVFSEELFRNDQLLTVKVSEVIELNNKILCALIKEGQQQGHIRDDIDHQHIVIMLMGSLRLFVKKWQFAEFGFDLEKEGLLFAESVIKLISK